MKEQYNYDAFISYRHAELDKFVAECLHKELESFRMPGKMAKKRKNEKNRIERVFRDKEELPLTSNLQEPIMQALYHSEWLIVICSPRLRESMWCKKEIETFVSLRGRERVLAVLVEGEPEESFPEELLYEIKKQTLPDGTTQEIKVPVEPLAADVRGKDKSEIRKLLKTEVLRILAAMFHMNYDELRQRHRERRMRKILTASFVGAGACLVFGIYSSVMALHISSQNKQIAAQAEEMSEQAEEIRLQNEELALKQALSMAELAQSYNEKGERQKAIRFAVEALTESDGIEMPYTPEAQYILAECVRAYDIGVTAKAEYQIEVAGVVRDIKQSSDRDTIAIYDEAHIITLFDLVNCKAITTIHPDYYDKTYEENGFAFVGEDKFAFINKDGILCIFSLTEKRVLHEIPAEKAQKIITGTASEYIVISQYNGRADVIDGNSGTELGTIRLESFDGSYDDVYISEDGYLVTEYSRLNENDESVYSLQFADLNSMKVLSTYDLGSKTLKDVSVKNGVAYIAAALYDESYFEADAYAIAVDMQSGNVLWENVWENCWVSVIETNGSENASEVFFSVTDHVYILDEKTGEEVVESNLEYEVMTVLPVDGNDSYIYWCANGDMIIGGKSLGQFIDTSYRFDCRTDFHAYIIFCPGCIAVSETVSDTVTVYTYRLGSEVKEAEEFIYPEPLKEYAGNEAEEIARNYGLENVEIIEYLYYSPDNKYCFAYYWDQVLVIYDVEQKEVVSRMEETYPTKWCQGTDGEGYSYIGGPHGIYMLNKSMQPVMWIDHGRYVDLETGKVYLDWNGSYYEAPLYSADDLLKIADEEYGVK